jgi:hypothetical protein
MRGGETGTARSMTTHADLLALRSDDAAALLFVALRGDF